VLVDVQVIRMEVEEGNCMSPVLVDVQVIWWMVFWNKELGYFNRILLAFFILFFSSAEVSCDCVLLSVREVSHC
jgi:hypothetical protein